MPFDLIMVGIFNTIEKKMHQYFEWDERKAKSNLKKHRVSFEEAAEVLGDEQGGRFHLDEFDDDHSEFEERRIIIGSHPEDRSVILFICWTERWRQGKRFTRIISARKAAQRERLRYAENLR